MQRVIERSDDRHESGMFAVMFNRCAEPSVLSEMLNKVRERLTRELGSKSNKELTWIV